LRQCPRLSGKDTFVGIGLCVDWLIGPARSLLGVRSERVSSWWVSLEPQSLEEELLLAARAEWSESRNPLSTVAASD
jgi:hypothetical protein